MSSVVVGQKVILKEGFITPLGIATSRIWTLKLLILLDYALNTR